MKVIPKAFATTTIVKACVVDQLLQMLHSDRCRCVKKRDVLTWRRKGFKYPRMPALVDFTSEIDE